MRWDNLFDDLEGQLEQELTAEEVDLRAEEERLRLARLGIRDRLLALHRAGDHLTSRILRLVLHDGTRISVTPKTFGRDWVAGELGEDARRPPSCIVPLDAITGMALTRDQVYASLHPAAPGTPDDADRSLAARLGLGFVLRDVCRRRHPVEVWVPGARLHGTLDRIGRDHCDLAVHEPGSVRRESAVTEYRLIRFSQILLVRL
jgi:hypothetical protein